MKKKILIIIITIGLISTLLIGAAVAYIAPNIKGTETSSTIVFNSGIISITYETNENQINASNILPGWKEVKNFTLTAKNNTSTTQDITYGVELVVTNNTFTDNAINYSLTGTSTNSGDKIYPLDGKLLTGARTVQIGTGLFSKSGDLKNGVTHTYSLLIGFPNDIVSQNDDIGKTFSAYVTIKESSLVENTLPTTAVETITSKYDNVPLLYGLRKDDTVDENIRFVGANPNNYVEFGNDNELWRIVGIFDVTDSSGVTGKKLKIMRNDSLGQFSWDARLNSVTNDYRGINDWNTATLMKELNGDYLNYDLTSNINWYNSYWDNINKTAILRQTGVFDYKLTIKKKYQNYISESVWNTGGNAYTTVNSAATLPTLGQYNAERGSKLYSGDTNNNVTRTSTWTGKVGLIYASDFGYASNDEECRNDLRAGQIYNSTTGNYDYANVNCKNNNWLHKGAVYWTLSSLTSNSDFVFRIYISGIVTQNSGYGTATIFPSLYLKSDTKIISGNGTETNPYRLG